MRLAKAWLIAARDFKVFRHQKSMLYALLIFPVIISILPLAILQFAVNRDPPLPPAGIPPILDAFSIFLIIGSAFVPLGIAGYTIVGEKIEKSLEPLLASPVTDGEILLGKTISAVLPALIAMYTGGVIFMVGTDVVAYPLLNYYYFPNLTIAVILFLGMPAATIMSVEFGVIVSSRVNDVRSATNFGVLMFFPFLIIYIASQLQIITLDTETILKISVILLVIDVVLYFISTALFQREEILTQWK
ncbi:MAG: ABC transporter permease subunit [Candidatus Thorarchaeota archaeon]